MTSLPSSSNGRGNVSLGLIIHLTCLTAVLAVAAVLRLYALPERGLIIWDEAKFALEGIRLQTGIISMLSIDTFAMLGKAVGSAKPMHAFLIGLSYQAFGVHDQVPLFLNALSSLLEVLLTYLLARRLFNPTVGLLAGLFMAVSTYDVIYARSALSESDATALLLAGVLLLIMRGYPSEHPGRGSRYLLYLLIAALLMSVGFTTNYRLIIYIAAIAAFDFLWTWHDAGWRSSARRMLPWAAGLGIPPLLWQLADLVARAHGFVLFRGDITEEQVGYFGEVLYQLHQGKQAVIHFEPLLYPQWYVARQGWLLLGLVLAGFGVALWRRSFPWLILTVPVLLPYLVYVFAPFIVPRNMVAALPFASVLAAASLVTLTSKLPSSRLASLVLLGTALLLTVPAGHMSWQVTMQRSGFARAASYMQSHGYSRALTTTEVMVFYLRGSGRRCYSPPLPLFARSLSAYRRAGYHLAVLENHHNTRISDLIRKYGTRVVTYPVLGPEYRGENIIRSENGRAPTFDSPREHVDIYSIADMHLPSPWGVTAKPCDRDHLA